MSPLVTPVSATELRSDDSLATSLLALNNAHASELSWLTPEALAHLIRQAWRAWRIGEADALLIALDQTVDYDSPNYHWFRARYDRFIYVDRIVVAQSARGRGLARVLYEQLVRDAQAADHQRIVCEVNVDPPNPQSDAFHAALGFEPLATASIHGGTKTVRYLIKPLS
ncbi:putative Acetyltransferase, GNAT family [Bradyrhizobium sp. ORS 285]|uniref:GNAT family N-acetyltransferase n=1 Tax=Bradyrhizobium sp. ORS 285 TaxID=115808 RepID=UPI0002405C75|nr:GNAT family N-acetyltransferase [Bradyrhizobium sp. ORS 285]CCD87765.1 putative Acetyltransferase, GNAT family [Bradyrhizobium sp. ORS 285]SMX61982.1 putative Acetyltransferase, GNAT family [Bradyrhizobium sp. ORS 285]